MQSHLTRRVFRAILNNEPVCFSPRRSRIYSLSSILPSQPAVYSRHVPSRGFFAFPVPPRPEATNVLTSEIGLQAMSDLSKSLSKSGRPPPFDVLCKAFQDFLEARAEEPGVITDFHAKHLSDTFEYIKFHQQEKEGREWQIISSPDVLETILYVLSQATCHPDSYQHVRAMAHNAYKLLLAVSEQNPSGISCEALLAYIRILAHCDSPAYAERVAMDSWAKLKSWPELSLHESPWLWIIKGLALKHNKHRVKKLITNLSVVHDYVPTPLDLEGLVETLIEQNDVLAARILYDCLAPLQENPTVATQIAVSKASILKGEGVLHAERILQPHVSSPNTETRDVLLLMEAAKGSGASALTHKLDEWSSKNPSIRDGLSVSCVNDLIKYANAIGNLKLAVEYSDLIRRWNLESDVNALLLLKLESRIQSQDVKGVLEILAGLEGDASINMNLSTRYQLINMLCQYPQNDAAFEQISKLLDPLIQLNIQIEPETLAALTGVLARRHEWDALSQLLRPRLSSYALINERPVIRSALLKFIYGQEQNDDNVWKAYQLLRVAFPETNAKSRTAIMNTFFKRKMIDKACQVFGHMRHSTRHDQHPTAETYVSCFLGLSRVADWDNVKLIRNMLKLDVGVELNTRLRNALMIALTACDKSDDAMDEFRDILRSDEGPTHNTLTIFFKVCESLPHGGAEATKMMKKITALQIPMDRQLYLAYIKAFAAQGEQEVVIQALEEMTSKIGQSPDSNMIARIYNVCPHEIAKDAIEEWTRSKFPSIWNALENAPRTEREEGMYIEGFEETLEP